MLEAWDDTLFREYQVTYYLTNIVERHFCGCLILQIAFFWEIISAIIEID